MQSLGLHIRHITDFYESVIRKTRNFQSALSHMMLTNSGSLYVYCLYTHMPINILQGAGECKESHTVVPYNLHSVNAFHATHE